MDETTTPAVVDEDSPLWDADPVPESPTDEVPTAEPPPDWDQGVHTADYEADPDVDTSPVDDGAG